MEGKATRPARNFLPKTNDATLMLLSKTGAGKSSLGNVILNLGDRDGFVVTRGLCATEVYEAVVKEATVDDRKIKVVDTPGVMDTNFDMEGNEDKVLSGICDGIVCCPDGVDAFLIVMRMDTRLTPEEFEAIAKLETLFGPDIWRYVILVFTRGDKVNNEAQQLAVALSEAQARIPALGRLISKLRVHPVLIDASGHGDPNVISRQMRSLKAAVDQLMSENQSRYTNEVFSAVKAALSGKTNAELAEKKRLADIEVQQLREKVTQLERDKTKIREDATVRTNEFRRKLEEAEERAKLAEEKVRKMEAEAKQKAEEAAKKFCAFL